MRAMYVFAGGLHERNTRDTGLFFGIHSSVLVPQSMTQVCGVARVVQLTTMVPSVALHN